MHDGDHNGEARIFMGLSYSPESCVADDSESENSNTGGLRVAHLDNINRVTLLLSFCKRSLVFIDPELGDKWETIMI